jgi:SOS-response transcriptional repressor LexA
MSWAAAAIARLQRGEGATVRPRGHSMAGKVEDGDTVTLAPLAERALEPGDVVLVRVHGRVYLHLVKAVQGDRVLIGNNRGGRVPSGRGWVNRAAVYGTATRVESTRR